MTELDNMPTDEKANLTDKKHILSYLSFLEKIYQQSQDNSHQERLFRINKAINSIKKYSNCKVSSFNLKPTKMIPTEKRQNLDIGPKEKNQNLPISPISELPEEKDNKINDIIQLIEKELKENGIDEKDINDSLLSTSKKSLNSPDNNETNEKTTGTADNIPKTNINHKRLSKLFLKIELKLKTYIQENNMKRDLINEEDEKENNNSNENNKNYEKEENNNLIYSFAAKSPSKLPNVIDSFFSDKNKVNSILQKVKKQRRKSVMDFNTKYCQLSKEEKENEYLKDSDGKDNKDDIKNKKRKKIVPVSAQVVMRNKITKKITDEKVSNFFDMIDEKEEDKEGMEDINAFDNIMEEEKIDNKISIKDNINENNINEKPAIFNIDNNENESSIKIASSLNNKSKFHFNINNNNNSNNDNNDNSNENKIINNVESCENNNNTNYFYVSRDSIFNNENENDSNDNNNSINNDNEYKFDLLDDDILMKSSDKKENCISQDEQSKESGESGESGGSKENSSDKSDNNSNVDDEKYNMLKYINDSKNRSIGNTSEENTEKNVSNFGKNISNESKIKNSVKREITRANNINGFCMNSILSPLKDVKIDKALNEQNNVIEDFSKYNI